MAEGIPPERRAELVRWLDVNWGYYDTSRGLIAGAMTRLRPVPNAVEQALLTGEWGKRREQQKAEQAAASVGAPDAVEGSVPDDSTGPTTRGPSSSSVDVETGEILEHGDDDIPFEYDDTRAGEPAPSSPSAQLATINRPAMPSLGLFGTADPVEVIGEAKRVADALVDVVEARELYTVIEAFDKKKGETVERKHIEVAAWTLLGSMLGVYPIVVWTRPLLSSDGQRLAGWEARVEARTRDGLVVGSAESECRFTERHWKGRASNDLRSMAQTRTTRRALAGPLGFVIQLAGYEPTLAEDLPVTTGQHRKLHALLGEISGDPPQGYASWDDYSHDRAVERFGVQSRSELTVREMGDLIAEIEELAAPGG